MEVIIKDGNRIVNWEVSGNMSVSELMSRWEKDYYPCDEMVVYDKDGKLVIEAKTQFPKKKRREEDDVR